MEMVKNKQTALLEEAMGNTTSTWYTSNLLAVTHITTYHSRYNNLRRSMDKADGEIWNRKQKAKDGNGKEAF